MENKRSRVNVMYKCLFQNIGMSTTMSTQKKTCFYSKIGQLICNRHIYWWTKVENPGETTDLPQVTDNLIT